jgi:hypothetical protein
MIPKYGRVVSHKLIRKSTDAVAGAQLFGLAIHHLEPLRTAALKGKRIRKL